MKFVDRISEVNVSPASIGERYVHNKNCDCDNLLQKLLTYTYFIYIM